MSTLPSDPLDSRNPADSPFDPAQQSLADALRTSFRILKFAILVIVVLFFGSGLFVVEQNEQAIVLRLGRPDNTGVRNPGFQWAFPEPIDEHLKLPVRQTNSLSVNSNWLYLSEKEKAGPISSVMRRSGLHPMRDGALLTADRGLVHIRWHVTYRIEDMLRYVELIADDNKAKADEIITHLLENAAVHVVSGYTTEGATRKHLTEIGDNVKRRVNEKLADLGTGIVLETVEIPESTPPVQTLSSFRNVTRAENRKESTIRTAQQTAKDLLNQTAGAVHEKLVRVLDELDQAEDRGDDETAGELTARVNRIVEKEASGIAGTLVRQAQGYLTSVVQRMRSDQEQYEALLSEYREQPDLLKERLWQDAKAKLFAQQGVRKIYIPNGTVLRLNVGPDPKFEKQREQQAYQQENEEFDISKLRTVIPGGPLARN